MNPSVILQIISSAACGQAPPAPLQDRGVRGRCRKGSSQVGNRHGSLSAEGRSRIVNAWWTWQFDIHFQEWASNRCTDVNLLGLYISPWLHVEQISVCMPQAATVLGGPPATPHFEIL